MVATNPGKDWASLVKLVVDMIAKASGLPTSNAAAIERAAAGALARLGVVKP